MLEPWATSTTEQYYMQCLELDARFLEAHVGLGVLDDLPDHAAALDTLRKLLLHPALKTPC